MSETQSAVEEMVTAAEDYYYDNSPFNGPDELREAIRQMLAIALAQAGMVLMPVIPTYGMCVAMGLKWEEPWEGGFPARYAALLAARHPPPDLSTTQPETPAKTGVSEG